MVKELEQKLGVIKRILFKELSKGEVESRSFNDLLYGLLVQEGLVSGKNDDMTKASLVGRVYAGLIPKINAKTYFGLKKDYVALSGSGLSESVAEDVRKYLEVRRDAERYLREKFGDEPVLKSEFENAIRDYLKENVRFSEDEHGFNGFRLACINGRISGHLKMDFKVKKNPEVFGDFNSETLEEALDRI